MMANILQFTDTPIIDESIEENEYHGYEPITGTSLNNSGDVRISIESQDVFTHPSESYLIFEGRLTKADGTLYVNADEVALTNNAIEHLFNRIEYHLSNQLIESLNYPGQATTMLGLLKYPDDFSKSQGLNQLCYKDTATTAVKATIMDLLQGMHMFSIYKTIESKVKLPVAYRTRQCDMLSVPESTSFTWRLSVKTASEKQRFIIVGYSSGETEIYYCWFSNG